MIVCYNRSAIRDNNHSSYYNADDGAAPFKNAPCMRFFAVQYIIDCKKLQEKQEQYYVAVNPGPQAF